MNEESSAMPPNNAKKRRVLLYQRWCDLLFLHWRADPKAIQRRLPPGLKVDTYEGKAYLGVVPFQMRGLRPRACPPCPGISTFPELNLRTYVKDSKERSGVWFFSLDAQSRISVAIAQRFFNLPYHYARMHHHHAEDHTVVLQSKRADTSMQHFSYRPTQQLGAASAGSLSAFLVERYQLFAHSAQGALNRGELSHRPYELSEVEVSAYSTELFQLNGFDRPSEPPCHAVYSSEVEVEVYPMQRN